MSLGDRIAQLAGGWLMAEFSTPRFLKHLREHLTTAAAGREKELVDRVEARAQEIFDADSAALVVDTGSRGMLAMSAAVLAAFEVLGDVVADRDRTILFLQHVFSESMVHSNALATRLLLRRGSNRLDAVESFMRPLTRIYGKAMGFEFERRGDEWFEMSVTRCFFKEFFDRHGERDVTTVMCAADAFWMDEIDPALTGLRSERTSLMSLGDDVDRFRVVATDDPLDTNRDVLRERGPGRPGASAKSGARPAPPAAGKR
jgi:L-2-amino-thiazoline-4-carboxylic acid hydrolase